MKEIIILGAGPSRLECPFDAEVWAAATILHMRGLEDKEYSKVFAFDPYSTPLLKRDIPIALKRGIPVVSFKEYATEKYPLDKIGKRFGTLFFKNTISYMIAYAIYLGYKKIRLYGVDQGPEWDYIAGRPYVLFWMGVAYGMGVKVELAEGSLLRQLMKLNIKKRFKEIKESKEWSEIQWAEKGPIFLKGANLNVKITGEPYKPIKKKRVRHRRDILAYLIKFALYLTKPFWTIKLCYIRPIAIGQQVGNTGLFLRRLQLYRPKRTTYIGITDKPDNKQLLKMFKRKMLIIQSKLLSDIHKEPIIYYSPFFQDLPFTHDCYEEMRVTKPDLQFTAEEEEQGKTLLERMGVDSWFVCFLSRDDAYLTKYGPNRQYNGEFRNSNVRSFMKAAEYITKCGGYAIRMGHLVEKELNTKNPRIIDYASSYRTDFGDIYLIAKCKFFLGDTAGPWIIAAMLNTPVAGTNFIPFHTPLNVGDIFIPKRLYSNDLKRELTLREYIDFCDARVDINNVRMLNKLLNTDHEIIENTSREILDLTKEMNERLNGFKETKETKRLQEKFQSLLTQNDFFYGTPARIGTEFLKGLEAAPTQNESETTPKVLQERMSKIWKGEKIRERLQV